MLLLAIYIVIIVFVLFIYLGRRREHFNNYKAKYIQKIPFLICVTHEEIACQQNLDLIKKLNPEYKVLFFDNSSRMKFIQQYFNTRVSNAYQKLIPGAYKADLFRYCFLFHQGGVYMDINKKLVLPLREIINPKASMGLVLNSNHKIGEPPKIINGFIYIVPQHPLMAQCIDQCVTNIENNFYGNSSLSVTGPYMFGSVFYRIFDKSLYSLGYGLHFHQDTLIHVLKYIENDQIVDTVTGKKVISFVERQDCKTPFTIQSYGYLWSNQKIYLDENK
jgi:mannosyltransferase OCH1-like enzyme